MSSDRPSGVLKGVLIILDGLGDRPVAGLGGRTPLEAATIPHLDALARQGICAMVRPLDPWIPVGTQVGTSLLMGLAVADVPLLSRGPVEAAGVGLGVRDGDIALRCNFVTLEHEDSVWKIADRRAGRIDSGTAELADAIDGMPLFDGVVARFRPSTQHRAVLLLSGAGLSASISDTDPGAGHEHLGPLPCEALVDGDPAADRTAALVNEFLRQSHKRLEAHAVNRSRRNRGLLPANGLLTRGAGAAITPRNFIRHLGLRATVITGEGSVVGLGRLFGFPVIREPGFTATLQTDIEGKVQAALRALDDNDLVFVHIKGPDVAAHDLKPEQKRLFIEKVDAAIAPLLEREVVLAVTGDHTTDSTTGRHTGDAVPGVIRCPGSRVDAVPRFTELACLSGGLGTLTSTSFLTAMLDHMNALHNYRGYEDVYFR